LQSILLKERELVEKQQLDDLPKVLQQKADLLSSIEHTHTQKHSWLSSRKLPLKLGDFTAQVATNPTRDRCLLLWAQLNQTKLQCNESNTVNGIIIAKTRKRNGEQLELLKGIKVGKPLYDAAGKTIGTTGKSDIRLA
jgi:flagellar biosynthesis/type III secretory pathway chaperone